MSLITIPQPGGAIDMAGSMRNRGAISVASAEKDMWGAVAGIGQKIQQKATAMQAAENELKDRQARFAVQMASIKFDQANDVWKMQKGRQEDWGSGEGFDQAVVEHRAFLEEQTTEIAQKVPAAYRSQWLQERTLKNEFDNANWENEMVYTRKVEYQKGQLKATVRSLALGMQFPSGGPIPFKTAPDPIAAMNALRDGMDIVPEKEQEAFLNDGMTDIVYGLMHTGPNGPQQAIQFLGGIKGQIPNKAWDSLMRAAKAVELSIEAETQDARKARAEEFEQAATDALLAGKFTFTDEGGHTVNWRDAIVNNPDLSPEKKRTLEGEWTSQMSARAKGKEYTELEKLEAKIEVSSEMDPAKKLALLKKYAPVLGYTEVKGMYEKMSDPAGDDSHLAAGLTKTIGAIREYRKEYEPDAEEEAKETLSEIGLLRLQDQVLRTWNAHPDWTTQQKIDEMQKVLIPAQEDTARGTVKKASIWARMGKLLSGPGSAPLLGGMSSGKARPDASTARVRVVGPDGRTGTMSEDELEEAMQYGWKRAG